MEITTDRLITQHFIRHSHFQLSPHPPIILSRTNPNCDGDLPEPPPLLQPPSSRSWDPWLSIWASLLRGCCLLPQQECRRCSCGSDLTHLKQESSFYAVQWLQQKAAVGCFVWTGTKEEQNLISISKVQYCTHCQIFFVYDSRGEPSRKYSVFCPFTEKTFCFLISTGWFIGFSTLFLKRRASKRANGWTFYF